VQAPKGAPNILLIMTDDVGFGAISTFGAPISTPVFDRLAASGLRYDRFHTTALCSPTRAALSRAWPRTGTPSPCARRSRPAARRRRERPLHRPQAGDGPLLAGELLAHHIGIAAMQALPLAQPVLKAIEQLRAPAS